MNAVNIADETTFLDEQAALACAATRATFRRAARAVTGGDGARGVAGRFPWASVGAAVAAGLAAGIEIAALRDRGAAEAAGADLQAAAGAAPGGIAADLPREHASLIGALARLAHALGLTPG